MKYKIKDYKYIKEKIESLEWDNLTLYQVDIILEMINTIEYLRKEIDGLVTVIDLVREYVRNNSIYYNTSDGCQWVDQFKILEILERVNEE